MVERGRGVVDEVNESIADVVVDGDGEMQTRSGLQFPSTAHYHT